MSLFQFKNSDPTAIFKSLSTKCQSPKILLSVLQRLLAIDHDKPEANRVWEYVDQVVEKVVSCPADQPLKDRNRFFGK